MLEQTFREQSEGKVKQVPPLRFMNRGMRMVVGGLEAQNKNGLRVSVTGGESIALLVRDQLRQSFGGDGLSL